MASKLSKLRQGKPPHKIINIRDMKVAIVIVSSDVIRDIEETVEQYSNDNKSRVNNNVRNQYFDQLLCYHCMRDPDNLGERLAESAEEVAQILDQEDISRVTAAYGDVMVNKSPKLELLSEDEFSELKKHLEVTQLSDLSTVSLVHLTNFRLATLSSE